MFKTIFTTFTFILAFFGLSAEEQLEQGAVNPLHVEIMTALAEAHPDEADYKPTKMEFITALAERGDSEGQHALGLAYYIGDGVEKDESKAFEWVLKAAEQDNINAMLAISNAYSDGIGVEQDDDMEAEWLQRASIHGSGIAKFRLAGLYILGRGVEKNTKFGEELMYQSIEAEPEILMNETMNFFAVVHEAGVLEDIPRSYAWYSLANDEESCTRLREVMTEEQLTEAAERTEEFKTRYFSGVVNS